MAKTIALRVKIPGLGTTHDFLIPQDMLVQKAVQLIAKVLREEYPAAGAETSVSMLMQVSSGLVLDNKSTLSQQEIGNGEEFVLL